MPVVAFNLGKILEDIKKYRKKGFLNNKKNGKYLSKDKKLDPVLTRIFEQLISDGATLNDNNIIYESGFDKINSFIKTLLDHDSNNTATDFFRFRNKVIFSDIDASEREELENKQKAMIKDVENAKKEAKKAKKEAKKALKESKKAKSKAKGIVVDIEEDIKEKQVEIEEKQGEVIDLEEEVGVLQVTSHKDLQNEVSVAEVTMSNITPNEDKITPVEEKSDALQVASHENLPDEAAEEFLNVVGRADNLEPPIQLLVETVRLQQTPIIEEKKDLTVDLPPESFQERQLNLLIEFENIAANLIIDPQMVSPERFEELKDKIDNIRSKKNPKSDMQKNINDAITRVRRLDIVNLRAIIDGLTIVRDSDVQIRILDERKSALEDAITRFKNNPIANDGLTDSATPVSQDANLIQEAVLEIVNDVEEDGVNDLTISKFKRLYDILSFDPQNIVRASITNIIEDPLSATSAVLSIPSRLLSRLIIRFVYHNTSPAGENRIQNDRMHEADVDFVVKGVKLKNRNINIVNKLMEAFKFAVPRPPEVPLSENDFRGFDFSPIDDDEKTEESAFEDFGFGQAFIEEQTANRERLGEKLTNRSEIDADLEMQNSVEEKERFGREEKREEDMEEDYIDEFEEVVSSAALRAAAIASSTGEALKILGQESFNTLKDFVGIKNADGLPLPAAIRPIIAARRVSRDIVPILRRNRAFQGLGLAAIMSLVVPVMMTLLTNFKYPKAKLVKEIKKVEESDSPREGRAAGTTREGDKVIPSEEIDTPQGMPMLRPSFKQLGTQYIDKMLNTPMRVQNSEWAEFDYAPFDRQNHIKVDNVLAADIRYREPMFMPNYRRPVKPPSIQSQIAMSDNMTPAIQLRQRFVPKFDASITRYDNLSKSVPDDPFARSWEDNILYYPI